MLEDIAAQVQALPLAVQLVGLMVILAVVDFVFAVIAHLKNGTFHGTIFAEWITSKGLPILTVAILYGLDSVLKLFINIDLGGTNIGEFGLLAHGMALTFIAQEAFSVIKNAKLFGDTTPEPPTPSP